MCSKTVLETRLSELFNTARDMVEHEDGLVNSRLGWILTFSGFLFATYGGSLIAEASIISKLDSFPKGNLLEDFTILNQIDLTRIILAVVGILSSVVGVTSIAAAHSAIRRIAKKYGSFVLKNKNELKTEKLQVWKLIGDAQTNVAGFQLALALPYILAMSWSILLIANVTKRQFPMLDGGPLFYLYCGVVPFLFWLTLARGQHQRIIQERLEDTEAEELTKISEASFNCNIAGKGTK